jgi:hypothetical protein
LGAFIRSVSHFEGQLRKSYRYKTILGDTLNARLFESQTVEMKLGGKILNKMAALGMPVSVVVAA